jgi:hypothetical protein
MTFLFLQKVKSTNIFPTGRRGSLLQCMAQGSPCGPLKEWRPVTKLNIGDWTRHPVYDRLQTCSSSHPTASFQWSFWDLFALILGDMKWWLESCESPQTALWIYETQGPPWRVKKQHTYFFKWMDHQQAVTAKPHLNEKPSIPAMDQSIIDWLDDEVRARGDVSVGQPPFVAGS